MIKAEPVTSLVLPSAKQKYKTLSSKDKKKGFLKFFFQLKHKHFPFFHWYQWWQFFTGYLYPSCLSTLSKQVQTLAGPGDPAPPNLVLATHGWHILPPDSLVRGQRLAGPTQSSQSSPCLGSHQKPVDEWCPGWWPLPKALLRTWIWKFQTCWVTHRVHSGTANPGMRKNPLLTRHTDIVYPIQQHCHSEFSFGAEF